MMIIDLSHIDGMVLFGSIVITVATYCLFWYHGARTASRWTNREWQESAIARDVARYHPKTGKWEWTVEPKTPEILDYRGNQILEKQP